MTITYVKGDATAPIGTGVKVIAHICNNIGAWGAGFTGALSKKYPVAESEYRLWRKILQRNLPLGDVQSVLVDVNPVLWVINMIAQEGVVSKTNVKPLKLWALAVALVRLADLTEDVDGTVHMPRIGCGLAGGVWEEVEPLIDICLVQRGISVTVYDLE